MEILIVISINNIIEIKNSIVTDLVCVYFIILPVLALIKIYIFVLFLTAGYDQIMSRMLFEGKINI